MARAPAMVRYPGRIMVTSSRRVLRLPGTMLGLVLVACGGGAPPQSPQHEGETATPAAPAQEAAPASGAEAASPGGAPDEKVGESQTGSSEFKTLDTHTAKETHGVEGGKLAPSKTEALLKLVVVDKDKGPLQGIVVSLNGADGKKFYAPETDAVGYAEVLVPVGQKYEIVYLGLGHKEIAATAAVDDQPKLTMKLTLRFKGFSAARAKSDPPRFVLDGVNFDTGKASLRPDSFPRLDGVVEYMTHKKSTRIEISGHTDNVGNPKGNKALSEKRASACRDYVISKGVDGSRVQAVGYGDERPVAPNDTEAGRQQNRRIEATEL
jgi:outer membrane protein OmpA-like peptidoglycan-associated protein